MTSLPTLEVLDARSLNTSVHAAIPKAAGPDAQRRSATCLRSGIVLPHSNSPISVRCKLQTPGEPLLRESLSLALASDAFAERQENLLHGVRRLVRVRCLLFAHNVLRLAFGLFHVRQELQIHLSARVLKRCQRVAVDFLTNARSFFRSLQASQQPDRLPGSL